MFNTISWQGYWTVLALLAAGYYLVIFLLYYRTDFKVWFYRKQADSIAMPYTFSSEDENKEGSVNGCRDEINAFFQQAKRDKCVKEELIYSLQSILKKYPSLKNSEYKESLNNLIEAQCENLCSVHLNANEVNHVWLS